MWPAIVSIVVSLTMLFGCGRDSGQESQSEAGKAPTERPALLDVLAAATPGDAPLPPGQPLPELAVEGWINGPPSKAAGSAGQILVVECWAYW